MTEPMPHSYECWVRWSDVDAYGHVNNVKYFEYFQEARIEAMGRSVAPDGLRGFVVARTVVGYRRPVLFRPEPYRIETRATRLGRSSFDLDAAILDGDKRLASSRTTIVAFDGASQHSRPLTDAEVDGVRSLLLPD
ncbi:MAG: acyl-CoA thioesterase [Nocardioidaceae bacterium]